MKRYSVQLSGDLLPGADRAEAVAALAELLRLPLPQADGLLSGRPKRIKGLASLEAAERMRERLARVGIPSRIRTEDGDAKAPHRTAPPQQRPSTLCPLSIAPPNTHCPSCDEEQPPGEVCRRCGIAFAKYGQPPSTPSPADRRPAAPPSGAAGFPYRTVNRLVLLVFLAGLGLAFGSYWKKDQLPPPEVYDRTQLSEPRQTATALRPFQIEAQGIRYTIEPLFRYELDGVVVSLHNSDDFWSVYQLDDWKNFLNVRDLCLVWGDNVATGVFRNLQYKNSAWTCWTSAKDPPAARGFAENQISNNHLLTHDRTIQEAIEAAEVGDQIRLSGHLVRYSQVGGLSRGSSVSRADSGGGASETVYVERFAIVRKSNLGWRLTYRISLGIAIAALLGLTVLFFVAPVRAPR